MLVRDLPASALIQKNDERLPADDRVALARRGPLEEQDPLLERHVEGGVEVLDLTLVSAREGLEGGARVLPGLPGAYGRRLVSRVSVDEDASAFAPAHAPHGELVAPADLVVLALLDGHDTHDLAEGIQLAPARADRPPRSAGAVAGRLHQSRPRQSQRSDRI